MVSVEKPAARLVSMMEAAEASAARPLWARSLRSAPALKVLPAPVMTATLMSAVLADSLQRCHECPAEFAIHGIADCRAVEGDDGHVVSQIKKQRITVHNEAPRLPDDNASGVLWAAMAHRIFLESAAPQRSGSCVREHARAA